MCDRLYFSYGSNMLPARLAARCPGAEFVCVAYAEGYRLEFTKRGMDGSGKATLTRARNARRTFGAVYRLTDDDVESLDLFEGPGYERCESFIIARHPDGQPLNTFTYIARAPETGLLPFDWYVALIQAGAEHHNINPESLKPVVYTPDTDPTRPSRLAAMEALAAVGVVDVAGFLERLDADR